MSGEDDAYNVGVEEPLSHAFSQNGPDAPLDLDNLHRPCAAIAKRDSDVQKEAISILQVARSGGLQ
jgi:hypothetical protein